MRARALVTAGGTAEPIDDVRVLTNRSTGRFGAALANALAAAGVEVTLLGSEALFARGIELEGSIRQVRFESSGELGRLLTEALAERPDLIFMAAAVSDYAPEPSAGKLSSAAEERSLLLRRTPKLLDRLRAACPTAYLVGFKLLSHVTPAVLIEVAREQVARASLDLCVANDLRELGGTTHPVVLVEAARAERIEGARARVAEQVALTALARAGFAPEAFGPRPAPAGVEQAWGGPALQLGAALELASDEPLEAGLARAAYAGRYLGPPRALRRGGASWILAGPGAGPPPVPSELPAELGQPARWLPLLDGGAWRGFLARGPSGAALAASLPPQPAGEPWVEALVAELADEPACWAPPEWRELLAARGFVDRGQAAAGRELWGGAALRGDLRVGASLCLYQPLTRRVLLGRRAKAPALGQWAFPGGGCEAGERPWATAVRELQEEAGLEFAGASAAARRVYYGEGGRAFLVHGFLGLTLQEPSPRSNGELLELGWFDLERALSLRPLTPGVRWALRALVEGELG